MSDSSDRPSSLPRMIISVIAILVTALVLKQLESQQPPTETTSDSNATNVSADSPPTTTFVAGEPVTLRISGVSSTEGEVSLALFFHEDAFPDRASAAHTQSIAASKAEDGVVTMEIAAAHFTADHPFAIAVYHDLNSDGKTNKSFLGKPTEPYGFTRNARQPFRAPDFQEAALPAFDATQPQDPIEIRLK